MAFVNGCALRTRSTRRRAACARVSPVCLVGGGGEGFVVAGAAAFLASAVAVAITHPIDSLKVREQFKNGGAEGAEDGTGEEHVTLRMLYKGLASNILKEAPNASCYLAFYCLFKGLLMRLSVFAAVPLLTMCLAGMLGDAVGSIVRVPAEIINKRLQLGLSRTWGGAIQDAFLTPNGVQNTLASWSAVLTRDVPYGGLQIAGYELVRQVLMGHGYVGLLFDVIAGSVAGLIAAVLTTPADVLVTRLSTQNPQCYLESHRYMGPIATFKRILSDEGFKGLWSGAFHRGMFYTGMIGLFFAAFEQFKYAILHPQSVKAVATAAGAAILVIARRSLPILAVRFRPAMRPVLPVHLGVLAVVRFLSTRKQPKSPLQH